MPPGAYQARLKVGSLMQTQPFTVLIDPNVAADGVTVADLEGAVRAQLRMRQLVDGRNPARQRGSATRRRSFATTAKAIRRRRISSTRLRRSFFTRVRCAMASPGSRRTSRIWRA